MDDSISRKAAIDAFNGAGFCSQEYVQETISELPSAQPEPQTARVFQEIIVEYPLISTYPECEGKPYFSIKYMEDGHDFIGYGTYKPEVLSEYLKNYFMPSAQPERKYTLEEVAEILASVIGDECACNINGIDEWLPESCKYGENEEECPNPKEKHGCWMQFLLQGGAQI